MLIAEKRTSKQYFYTCSFGTRRMVGELDVRMGAHVVLRRDFVWMYFVKEGTDSLGARCSI